MIRLETINNAISAIEFAEHILSDMSASPELRGHAAAKLIIAGIDLKVDAQLSGVKIKVQGEQE